MTTTTAPTKDAAPAAPAAGTPAQSQSTALERAAPAGPPPVARAIGGVIPWDPFALMDRLDADAFIEEMQGIASDVLVYTIKDGGKETIGLSKGGIDECCTMLVTQGQVIREDDLTYDFLGDGEDRECIFKVKASRYAVDATGKEVRLDSVLGVKREPLYEERAPLSIDSRVPGKKWRHITFREALENDDAVGYLEWIVEKSTFDDGVKAFCRALLDGEDVREFALGKRFNTFWFEHGAMKAARNARFRLIPAGLKAQVIAMAKESARVREVSRDGGTEAGNGAPVDPREQTKQRMRDKQEKANERERPTMVRRSPQTAGYSFPFGPLRGTYLDAKHPDGHESAGKYVVSDELISRAQDWADGILNGKAFQRNGEQEKRPLGPDEDRGRWESLRAAMAAEVEARGLEGEEHADAAAEAVAGDQRPEDEKRADPTAAGRSTATGGGNAAGSDASATDAGTRKATAENSGVSTTSTRTLGTDETRAANARLEAQLDAEPAEPADGENGDDDLPW